MYAMKIILSQLSNIKANICGLKCLGCCGSGVAKTLTCQLCDHMFELTSKFLFLNWPGPSREWVPGFILVSKSDKHDVTLLFTEFRFVYLYNNGTKNVYPQRF